MYERERGLILEKKKKMVTEESDPAGNPPSYMKKALFRWVGIAVFIAFVCWSFFSWFEIEGLEAVIVFILIAGFYFRDVYRWYSFTKAEKWNQADEEQLSDVQSWIMVSLFMGGAQIFLWFCE